VTEPFRIAVLVSGSGTNLQALIDTVHGAEVEIVAVAASRAGVRALERAERADIETGAFPAGPGEAREARDEALGAWLSERDVQLVVLAGWMELLGPDFIGRFAGRIINVHPSLLPAFAGLQAIEQAVEYGVKVTGVTVHFVDSGIDTGAVILQEALGLSYPAPIADIEQRVHGIEYCLCPRAVRLIARGRVRPDPDNPRVVLIDDGD
jgi:phosphoribosylglycinamide formyltransferase 1